MNKPTNKILFFNEELIGYITLKSDSLFFMNRLVINSDITIPATAEFPISQKDIPTLQEYDNRRLIISTSKEWKESSVPGGTTISTKLTPECGFISYTNVITTIDVALNLKESDEIVNNFDNIKAYELLQQILNYILYKINATSNGERWYNFPLSTCGPQRGGVYKINRENGYKIELLNGITRCNYQNEKPCLALHASSLLDEKVFIWKYYYNRALASFNCANLIDFIINGALACESFFYYLLRKNNLECDFEDYIKHGEANTETSSGAFTIIKFLFDGNLITKEEKKLYNKVFGKLKEDRNNIIHGKIENPNELCFDSVQSACIELQNMFNFIESKEFSSIKSFKTVNLSLINKLKDKIEKTITENDGLSKISDFSELKKDINNLISYNLDLATCHLYLGEIYCRENNSEKAIEHFQKCLSYNDNIGYAAYRLAGIYNTLKKFDEEKKVVILAIRELSNNHKATQKTIDCLEKLHLRAFFFELYDECFLALKKCFDTTKNIHFAILLHRISKTINKPDFIFQEALDLLKEYDGKPFRCYDYDSIIKSRKT